jgi:lysophospholipase L1-like esterase
VKSILATIISGLSVTVNSFADSRAAATLPPRIVFLGASITDGHTHPLIIDQALREAGRTPPTLINAGIGGDRVQDALARLDRDVFVHEPDAVVYLCGTNNRGQSVAEYEQAVDETLRQLQARRLRVILCTLPPVTQPVAETEASILAFNAVLRRLAAKHDCDLAEVHGRLRTAMERGVGVHEADGVHLNFEAYRLIARVLLDLFGCGDLPVPADLKPALMPGVVREWRIRAVAEQDRLTEAAVAALRLDDSWKRYPLPEPGRAEHWWQEHERQRGVAVQLPKLVGASKRYQGIATVSSSTDREVYFNTGANLEAVWLNGRRIYQSAGWTGWHPGKERLPARLRAGENVVVVETGPAFFLSITDDNRW